MMKASRWLLVFGLLFSAAFHTYGQSTDLEGWTTILGGAHELEAFPTQQVEIDKEFLHVRSGAGVLVPQPSPNGAIRARFHFLTGTTFPQLRIRRSADGGTDEAAYYNLIMFIRDGQSELKKFDIMKIIPKQQGKVIGTVHLPQSLRIGDQMDIEFSAVGNRLQISVDGKPSLEIQDDAIPTSGYWGPAAGNAWFSNIQVRSLTLDGKPTSAVASALQVMVAKYPKLAELHAAYEVVRQRNVEVPYQEGVKALNAHYQAALDRSLAEATQASKLDDALAIRDEKKRVEENKLIPSAAALGVTVLKSLQATYRSSLQRLAEARDQAEISTLMTYDRTLETALNERTQAADLEGALLVKQMRVLLQSGIEKMGRNAIYRFEQTK